MYMLINEAKRHQIQRFSSIYQQNSKTVELVEKILKPEIRTRMQFYKTSNSNRYAQAAIWS